MTGRDESNSASEREGSRSMKLSKDNLTVSRLEGIEESSPRMDLYEFIHLILLGHIIGRICSRAIGKHSIQDGLNRMLDINGLC